ncbi:unnamed protein product [Urochloa humidicola]
MRGEGVGFGMSRRLRGATRDARRGGWLRGHSGAGPSRVRGAAGKQCTSSSVTD